MAFNKVIAAKDIQIQGGAFTKTALSSGFAVRYGGINNNFYTSGRYIGSVDSAMPSFTASGIIDSTGTVLFNNDTNGGCLGNIIVANRGANSVYIGFNNTTPSVSGGFPIASGESVQYENQFVTEFWGIVPTGFGNIYVQGLYRTDKTKVLV